MKWHKHVAHAPWHKYIFNHIVLIYLKPGGGLPDGKSRVRAGKREQRRRVGGTHETALRIAEKALDVSDEEVR